MAGTAGALFGAAEAVAGGPNFEMLESLLILAVVAIGGASVCSGALTGGLAVGFLPGNAQDVFIGAGTVALAFLPRRGVAPGLRPLPPVVGQRDGAAAVGPGAGTGRGSSR
jgi:ABC-type branched-subunit amino acid transport system permease subunit